MNTRASSVTDKGRWRLLSSWQLCQGSRRSRPSVTSCRWMSSAFSWTVAGMRTFPWRSLKPWNGKLFRPCFVFSSVALSNLLLLDTRCFAPTQLCASGRRCAALAPWPHPPGSSALRCGEAGSELHHLRNHSCLQNGPNVYVWSLSGMERPAHTLHQLVVGLDNCSKATMVKRSHYIRTNITLLSKWNAIMFDVNYNWTDNSFQMKCSNCNLFNDWPLQH